MPGDAKTVEELEVLCRVMPLDELVRFCEGTLRAAVVAQRVLIDRDRARWQALNEAVDSGELLL